MMIYIRELWLWFGQHPRLVALVLTLVALVVAVAIVWQYDLFGAMGRLRELVGQ